MNTPDFPTFPVFVEWYRSQARDILRKLDSDRATEWDTELKELEDQISEPPPTTTVCFLGNSGVGKSTLINALVAGMESVLPAGGVGPLTAKDVQVQYSPKPAFAVRYHLGDKINRLIFSLHSAFRQELSAEDLDQQSSISPDEQTKIESLLGVEGSGTTQNYRDELLRQARLMVRGDQSENVPVGYIIRALCVARDPSNQPNFSQVQKEDEERIYRLREALRYGRESLRYRRSDVGLTPNFRKDLEQHAAGFLAPLIQDIEVEYPSEFLQAGICVVDLPGLGVSDDIYRRITTEYIRDKARAIVLVVDRAGISEAVAELLRTSEFLNRLLYCADEPEADPVQLFIAVTRVDDLAREKKQADPMKQKLRVHFTELKPQLRKKLKEQLSDQLQKIQRQGRQHLEGFEAETIDRVVSTTPIHPLSAVEYRLCVNTEDDDESRPFVEDADESGVPELQRSLIDLAQQRQTTARNRMESQQQDFMSRVLKTIQTLIPDSETIRNQIRTAEFLREFDTIVAEQQTAYATRKGMFAGFWKDTLPESLKLQLLEARTAAIPRMKAYLDQFEEYNVSTLRASIPRGGVFNGARRVDLPRELASCFDNVIAERWGTHILKKIREETSLYALALVEIPRAILRWAEAKNFEQFSRQLSVQISALEASAKQAAELGRDRTAELRKLINQKLVKSIEGPIRKKCLNFAEEGKNKGQGVRMRIVDFFRQIGHDAAEVAMNEALPMLQAEVNSTAEAIRKHSLFQRNPLDEVRKLGAESTPHPTEEEKARLTLGQSLNTALLKLQVRSASPKG